MKRKQPQKAYLAEIYDRKVKGKFLEDRIDRIAQKPLIPMNERQSEYIQSILNMDMTVVTGYAGSSKTFIAATLAADAFRKGEASKIYLCRPNVSNSKSLGYFSGDSDEKLMNWLMPIISVIKQRMGATEFNLALKEGNIELIPLETIKGMSFGKGVWVLIDEAEDLTIDEVKCIVTRMGGAKAILMGDTRQSVLHEDSGLAMFYRMVQGSKALQEHVGHICFDEYSHIVRSAMCRRLIIEFDNAGY